MWYRIRASVGIQSPCTEVGHCQTCVFVHVFIQAGRYRAVGEARHLRYWFPPQVPVVLKVRAAFACVLDSGICNSSVLFVIFVRG